MNYLVTGLNHNTALVDIRERVAMTDDALPEGLRELSQEPGVYEAMIVSTCNRVELVSYDEQQPNLIK
jgi:glutamyl-tRNA reductase